MFTFDLLYFKEDRTNKLLVLYSVVSASLLGLGFIDSRYFYSVIGTALYGLVVLAYMYKDTEYLKANKTNQLDDALKYFLDVEGVIVRYFIQKKKTD